MHPIARVFVLAAVGFLSACGGSTEPGLYCSSTHPTECATAGGGGGAAVVHAAIAGGLWVGAGGCKINGCEPPMRCNEESQLCERIRCGESEQGCPAPYECNERRGVCY